MSEQNGNERVNSTEDNIERTSSAERPDYSQLKIEDLKKLAGDREITPQGNKSSKETWVEALKAADRAKTTTKDSTELKNSDNENDLVSNIKGKAGSAEAQESIFDEVISKLDQRGVSVSDLSLTFDGKEALSYKDSSVTRQSLTDEQSRLLKSALNDPQNFAGSVTIKSGNRTLLKIENGQVIRDTIGLTSKSTKIEVESSTRSLYEKYTQNLESKGLSKTKQVIQNALKDGMSEKQVKKIIRSEDDGYKNIKENNSPQEAETNLNKIVNRAIAQNSLGDEKRDRAQEKTMAKTR